MAIKEMLALQARKDLKELRVKRVLLDRWVLKEVAGNQVRLDLQEKKDHPVKWVVLAQRGKMGRQAFPAPQVQLVLKGCPDRLELREIEVTTDQ